jgi:hypothetical protein
VNVTAIRWQHPRDNGLPVRQAAKPHPASQALAVKYFNGRDNDWFNTPSVTGYL